MENKKKLSAIDAGLLITFATAYVYFCAYKYESGYCDHFHIPSYLIEPSLNTILSFATGLFAILVVTFQSLSLSLSYFNKIDQHPKIHLRPILKLNSLLLIAFVTMIYVFPLNWWVYLGFGTIVFTSNLLTWGLGSLLMIGKKEPIAEGVKLSKDTGIYIGWKMILDYVGHENFNLILFLFLFPSISYFLGLGAAVKQSSFHVLNGRKNIAVLKKYDGFFVCTKIDINHHLISDSTFIYKLAEHDSTFLVQMELGELHDK